MFLFLDESEAYTKKVIGGLLVPLDKVSELEKDFTKLRIEKKLFGEIKWTSIDNKYHKDYCDFISLFFNENEITYHSCSYNSRESRYKAAYLLVRATSWKMQNLGINEPFYVLFDEDGVRGRNGCAKIKEILGKDRAFNTQLDFCNQGHSHIMGCLQITDLITGAVATHINNRARPANHKKYVLEYIINNNGGNIGFPIYRFPKLYEYKMHHYELTKI